MCIGDRRVIEPQAVIAWGYACALMIPYGVGCDVDYRPIESICPSYRDKGDWIFSLHYKLTGECGTVPGATRLVPRVALPTLYPEVKPECLERRLGDDVCISDRTRSVASSSTLLARTYACSRMAMLGVDCDDDFGQFAGDCPSLRDMYDWTFSTHAFLTGECNVQPSASVSVARDTLSSTHPDVKRACLERLS